MADIEDGEILDSDEENHDDCDIKQVVDSQKKITTEQSFIQKVDVHQPLSSCRETQSYRQFRHKVTYSDSDSSVTSDEDTDLWRCKKAKYLSKPREKSMELSYEICSPPRRENLNTEGKTSNFLAAKKRKVNNIWGSVLEEQNLTSCMTGVLVDKPDLLDDDRDVEKYNYTKKYEDDRLIEDIVNDREIKPEVHNPFEALLNSVEPEGLQRNISKPEPDLRGKLQGRGRKRKKKMEERLGELTVDKSKDRGHIKATADDSKEDVLNAILSFLNESNRDLFSRVISVIGSKKALELTYLTDDVEGAGGLLINNGSRRRTPGGVFIQLLKKDKHVTGEQIKDIFAEEEEKFKQKRKEAKKEKRKRQRRAFKNLPQSKYMNKSNLRDSEMDVVENRHSSNSENDFDSNVDDSHSDIEDPRAGKPERNIHMEQSDMIDLGVEEDCCFD